MKKEPINTGNLPLVYNLSLKEAESFSDALSDVVCWLSGFKSAGGVYAPESMEVLRDLNIKLKSLLP